MKCIYCNDIYFWEVLEGLKVGNEALKKIREVLNVDEVERILEETRERMYSFTEWFVKRTVLNQDISQRNHIFKFYRTYKVTWMGM
jgi:hypothetical protein